MPGRTTRLLTVPLPLHTTDRSGFEGIEGLDARHVRLDGR